MTSAREVHRAALRPLLDAALRAPNLRLWAGGYLTVAGRRIDDRAKDDEIADLEDYLIDHSGLPARLDDDLLAAFADELRAVCRDESLSLRISYNAVAWLLEGWRFLTDAPLLPDAPRVILPCCAVIGAGIHAAAFRAAAEGVRVLMRAASTPLSPVREAVVRGLRLMLAEDWLHTMYELRRYAHIGSALEHALAAAAVSEAGLLTHRAAALDALDLLHMLMAAFRRLDCRVRSDPEVEALRQALGQGISTVAAAVPETGLAIARAWLTWDDPDISPMVYQSLADWSLVPEMGQPLPDGGAVSPGKI